MLRPCFFHRAALCLGMAMLTLGCNGSSDVGGRGAAGAKHEPAKFAGEYPIHAVATTGMVADLAKRVGGERINVLQLMGEGVDPHLYKASPGDVSQLSRADIIFYSGLHLEGKMADVLEHLGREKPTVAVAEAIAKDKLLQVGEHLYDPHVWFDVSLWRQTIDAIESALAEFDPPHKDEYRKRAEAYRAELTELHEECRRRIGQIPAERRVLVTAHDAFHYFGRAYDLEVKAIQGISTQAEAGIKQINDLVEFISRRGVKAVFVETSVSERNIEALVEGCRARGHEVEIGGQLFSDAMGQPGTPEGTYAGMVRHNVEAMVKALE